MYYELRHGVKLGCECGRALAFEGESPRTSIRDSLGDSPDLPETPYFAILLGPRSPGSGGRVRWCAQAGSYEPRIERMTQVAETTGMQETTRDIAQSRQLYEQAMKSLDAGQIETAIDRLDEAHELDHENEEVMFKLAYLLDLRGDDMRAIEIYEILADRRPVREGVLINLAILYEDTGQYDNADLCLERILSV